MSTQAQIQANRLNAQKSTGPRTDEGKQAISENAVTHGLTSSKPILAGEDPQAFRQFADNMRKQLCPKGPIEDMLVDRIIALSWRLQRSVTLQSGMYNEMERETRNRGGKPDTALVRAIAHDYCNDNFILDGMLLQETRIEKSLYKSMLELQRIQFIRTQYQSLISDRRDYSDAEFAAEKAAGAASTAAFLAKKGLSLESVNSGL